MNKFSDEAAQKTLFDLREALYEAYDAGNEPLVYRLSRHIDRLQLECVCFLTEASAG